MPPQISGAIFGALFSAGLVAGSSIGMGDGGPGCFDHKGINPKLTNAQIFGWEALMTFTLISVVYACGVAKPGHGSFTPLAVGLSLVACAGAGGRPGALGGCDPGGVVCMPAQQSSGSLLAFWCLRDPGRGGVHASSAACTQLLHTHATTTVCLPGCAAYPAPARRVVLMGPGMPTAAVPHSPDLPPAAHAPQVAR
jgi:hypothetical protein